MTLLSPRTAVLVGALALLLEVLAIIPPIDDATATNATLHYTQHGVLFLGGLLMGVALRDLLVAGRPPMTEAAIEVEGLRKAYGALEAVRGISFTVARGEVFALLGPNGAGKTTTVEILEGYRHADAGVVRVLGMDPATGGTRLRARIGIVLQAERRATLPARARGRRAVRRLLPATRGPSARCSPPSAWPSRRRRARAHAVGRPGAAGSTWRWRWSATPRCVFLDEPTTGFDPGARRAALDDARAASPTAARRCC